MKPKHNYSLAWVTIAAIIGLVLVATLCSCMKTEPEDENGILDQVVVYCADHPRYVARGIEGQGSYRPVLWRRWLHSCPRPRSR